MLSSLLTASLLVASAQAAPSASRADMGVRLQTLERAWRDETDPDRRAAAASQVSEAVAGFFSGRFDAVSLAIDEARAALAGSERRTSDALRITVNPVVAEPGQRREITLSWVYDPGTTQTVAAQYQFQRNGAMSSGQASLSFGSTATLGVPADWNPVLLTVDDKIQEVWAEVIPDFAARMEALRESGRADLQPLLNFIDDIAEGRSEVILPVAPRIELAEAINSGETDWSQVQDVFRAQQNGTRFRAWFPEDFNAHTPVIVALHGAGGSEEMFFESYGAGLAVELAQQHGWALISPQSTPQAARDVLQWVEEVHGFRPETRFVMGHSMGGGLAMQATAAAPHALVLFAPAGVQIHPDLQVTPTFLAVGAQEMMMLRLSALRLRDQTAQALPENQRQFVEIQNSEHLMIVADALPLAFEFLAKLRESP